MSSLAHTSARDDTPTMTRGMEVTRTALEVTDLVVRYGSTEVFAGLHLTVEPGEVVALMGPSGSGKSSLLACVSGMLVPQEGSVAIAGTTISSMSTADRASFRRAHLGLVFQDADLLPELSVEENVALTLLFDRVPRKAAATRARAALAQVGLEGFAARRVDELSGGQAQRVALARALVRPEVTLLVADEPTASLDADNAARMTDLLIERARSMGAGTLIATHDPSVAARCDRIHDLRLAALEVLS